MECPDGAQAQGRCEWGRTWVGIQRGGPDRKSRLVPHANKEGKTGAGASNTAVLCAVTTEGSTERLWLKVMPSILCGLVHHLETKWLANNLPQALCFISFFFFLIIFYNYIIYIFLYIYINYIYIIYNKFIITLL